jgi:CubicO group peptidase (beta-lactamase class C family)
VHEWELTGIQQPLDAIVRDLPYEILRRPTRQVAEVQVPWTEDMPPRVAIYYGEKTGCSILPLGAPAGASNPGEAMDAIPEQASASSPAQESEVSSGRISKRDDDDRGMQVLVLGAKALNKDRLETYGKGARTTAVLVRSFASDGALDFSAEFFAPGFTEYTPQRTWSVAKSIAATMVGMAVHSGEYAVSDPVGLNYWRSGGGLDVRNAITIDHALRMATGRYSDTPGNRTDPIYFGGGTVDEYATAWPVIHPPGTVYRYANNDTLLAVKAVQQYLDYYSPADLLAKIGMTDTVVETDWKGGYVLSSQVWATAEDLAGLGQLYLQDGVWRGERVLPEGWREYVSTPSGPQPDGPFGYGAGWWLMNASEGVPPDTFAAFGNRGQYVVVVPSRNVVIVRRGEDMVGTRFDIAAFTRDVLAALD